MAFTITFNTPSPRPGMVVNTTRGQKMLVLARGGEFNKPTLTTLANVSGTYYKFVLVRATARGGWSVQSQSRLSKMQAEQLASRMRNTI